VKIVSEVSTITADEADVHLLNLVRRRGCRSMSAATSAFWSTPRNA